MDSFKLDLPWIERLDLTNDLAPMAPEQAIQLEKHAQKRASLFAGNAKIKSFAPEEDPVLNDFKRELTFHRQAQAAVLEGIKRLHDLGLPTKRPDDYFAEMAKSDEQMQKVRSNLVAKQQGQAKSERLRQIREQRKIGKLIQRQSRVQKDTDKREMLENLKKFRKGKLKNLDFLDDNRKKGAASAAAKGKRKERDTRFGYGGKKSGAKRNTKESSMDVPSKARGGGRAGKRGTQARPGKEKRLKTKSKSKGRRK